MEIIDSLLIHLTRTCKMISLVGDHESSGVVSRHLKVKCLTDLVYLQPINRLLLGL